MGNMKSSLQKVKEDLKNLEMKMQNELKSLNKERDDIMEEIQKFKNRIIARLEELEKSSLDELQKQHKALADNINANSSKINDIKKNVEIRLIKLNLSQDANEAQLFVDINYGEKELRRAIECVKTSADRDVKNMSFGVVKEIEKYLEDTESLGKTTIISQSRFIPKKHVTDRPERGRHHSSRYPTSTTSCKESSSSDSDEDIVERLKKVITRAVPHK